MTMNSRETRAPNRQGLPGIDSDYSHEKKKIDLRTICQNFRGQLKAGD